MGKEMSIEEYYEMVLLGRPFKFDPLKEKFFKRYGSSEKVRFLDTSQASTYDSEGNIVTCGKCDKPAVEFLMGKETYVGYCEDHASWRESV